MSSPRRWQFSLRYLLVLTTVIAVVLGVEAGFARLWPEARPMFFSYLIGPIPLLLIYTTGLTIAALQWNKRPHVARLAAIAFGIFTVNAIVSMGLQMWSTTQGLRGTNLVSIGWNLAIFGIVRQVAAMAAYVLILIALFRPGPAQQEAEMGDDLGDDA